MRLLRGQRFQLRFGHLPFMVVGAVAVAGALLIFSLQVDDHQLHARHVYSRMVTFKVESSRCRHESNFITRIGVQQL